jgi:hypothetical protein
MISWILRAVSKLCGLFRQTESSREFNDEVETHIELLTARFVDQGMTREQAASDSIRAAAC